MLILKLNMLQLQEFTHVNVCYLVIFSSLKQERFHKTIRCKANMYGGTQKSGHPPIHLEDDFWDDTSIQRSHLLLECQQILLQMVLCFLSVLVGILLNPFLPHFNVPGATGCNSSSMMDPPCIPNSWNGALYMELVPFVQRVPFNPHRSTGLVP